jgi:nucleotide-binding universal stress UspA family protein
MAVKKDAAADLAGHLVQVLEAQRRLGSDSYPPTLRRLTELTDPATSDELVRQAVKKKPFKERAVLVLTDDPNPPVILADDVEPVANGPFLLEFALNRVCSPDSPTCDAARLKKLKWATKLKAPFAAAVARRLADGDVPPGVAVVTVKKKKLFHLVRYPLPRPPEIVLAEGLLRVLRERRAAGDYPVTFSRLVELAQPGADAALVKKALAQPVVKDNLLSAFKDVTASPVALAEDRDLLVDSASVLEAVLLQKRSAQTQIWKPADLKTAVVKALQGPFVEAVNRRAETGTLPPTVGCLRQKGAPLLFLKSDVSEVRPAPPSALEPERTAPPPEPMPPPNRPAHPPPVAPDFARLFDDAFERLDRLRGHNFVSLVDLRRELPVDRATFDAGLQTLRQAGRYTLGAAEGRHGISPEERQAGIEEDGSLLLHVSRKKP